MTGMAAGQDPSGSVAPARGDEVELQALCSALVEGGPDGVVVLEDGIIRYVNPAATSLLGWRADQALGHHVVEFVHPDDAGRAALDLEIHAAPGAPTGYSQYSVARADGSWLRVALSAAHVTAGAGRFMALYFRPSNTASANVLSGLLRGSTPRDMLAPVCELFDWTIWGSRVGISWEDDDGFDWVGTDLPAELVGGGDGASDTPWARCRRDRSPKKATDLSALDRRRRHLAEQLGLGAYWIEPVLDEDGEACAVITLWMASCRPVPEIHSLGMSTAKDFVELIVRWMRQARQLHDAAHRDALTGLANRKALFDDLERATEGALLYCDLDGFKDVNDRFGHRVGDELLRVVASRIRNCVRAGDVVARLGGDEFAVLSPGTTPEQAHELARRIRATIAQPFQIAGRRVRVGISIGVGHSTDGVGEKSLEQADRALYEAKAEGKALLR